MSMNPEDLQDLLNGLLDGVLTDDEQRRLELAMKEDPTLEAQLNELQTLRNSLLRGRSVGRLGPEFSKGVVAEARKRAEMMGERAPEWLRPPAQRSADRVAKRVPAPAEPRVRLTLASEIEPESHGTLVSERAWRVWVPALAVASLAAMTFFLASPWISPRLPVEPLAVETSETRADERTEKEAMDQAVEILSKESHESGSGVAADSRVADTRIGEMPTQPVNPETSAPEISLPREPMTEFAPEQALATDAPAVTSADTELPKVVRDMLDAKGVKPEDAVFTLVAEVIVGRAAREDDALRALMDQYDIVYADDVNLDDQQLRFLESSQMVGMMSGVDVAKRSDDVQVFFLRAKASKIDSFLTSIQSQYEAFPGFHLDMSFDPSVLTLVDQLRSIVTSDDSARRLTFHGKDQLGLVTAFPSGTRDVQYMDIGNRKRVAAPKISPNTSKSNADSYLLLLVKPGPEEGAPN